MHIKALSTSRLLKWDVGYFSPVIACPYSFRFHFSVIWLITSLSGLSDVICCTSLPGCLPSPAAISSRSSVSPSEVCSPAPAPPQHVPLPGDNVRAASPYLSPCWGSGSPSISAEQQRQQAGERSEDRRQPPRPAAQHPGGSGQPASIWTHQAKQLCWVPYVWGARIHDIRAHLVYNKPPFPSPPQSVFPLHSSTTCHPSGEPGEAASTFSQRCSAGSFSATGAPSQPDGDRLSPGHRRRAAGANHHASSIPFPSCPAALRAPSASFFPERAGGARL